MPSEIIWGTLAGLFISAVYFMDKLGKRNRTLVEASTWMQKHAVVVGAVAILVPLSVGVILVNTVFGADRYRKVHKRVHREQAVVSSVMSKPIKPAPLVKLIVTDGSQELDVAVLNHCASEEVTVVHEGSTNCVEQSSPVVRAWYASAKLHATNAIDDFIEYQIKQTLYLTLRKDLGKVVAKSAKKIPPVMRQGWLMALPAAAPEKTETVVVTTENKPFKDRNAELFYFLALVLGVLGKYFWDYYEDKREGKAVAFEAPTIVISFIIAALVYYSIQQGIEKEANKLTTRGVMFAFNSGFMWQTILTSMNRTKAVAAAVADPPVS